MNAPRAHGGRLPGIRAVWLSPALRVTFVFGIAGMAFAGANILLARALSASEYGMVALFVALVQLAVPLSPLGLDGVVNRRKLDAGPRLLRRVLVSSTLVGTLAVVAGAALYHLSPPLLALLFVCSIGGGANQLAGASYQSRQRFGESLSLTQSPVFFLALGGALALVFRVRHGWLPLAVFAAGFVLTAGFGWFRLFRERAGVPHGEVRVGWFEGLAIVGISAAVILLIQLERLVIPAALSIEALATFAVLASIAGSPYRMMQMGVGYTMLPRLRAAATAAERRRLIAREGIVVFGAVSIASIAVWTLTPWIVHLFLAHKYVLSRPLIAAAVFTGVCKVGCAFASSANVALGSPRQLAWLNAWAWTGVGVATAAAFVGARWGLAGVIYGVGAGWFFYAVAASLLASRHLADPPQATIPAAAPAEL